MINDYFASSNLSLILSWLVCIPTLIGIIGYTFSIFQKHKGVPWLFSAWVGLCFLAVSPLRYMLFQLVVGASYLFQSVAEFISAIWLAFYVPIVFALLSAVGFAGPLFVVYLLLGSKPSRTRYFTSALAAPVIALIGSLLFSFLLPFASLTTHWLPAEGIIKATNGPAYYVFNYFASSRAMVPLPPYISKTPQTALDYLRCHVAYIYLSEREQARFLKIAYPEIYEDYAAKSSQSTSIGELGPHWTAKQFRYVGEFYRNYVYLIGDEDGHFGERLAGDQYSADIYTVREDMQILFRDPKSGRFAVLDSSDPASSATKPSDLKFEAALTESIPSKAWQRATNPKNYLHDLKKGRQQEWIYVDSLNEPKQSDSVYVGTTVKSDSESGYSFVPLLVVNQQRITFYLDPRNRKFAPVAADAFGTPLEEIKYRDMDERGVAQAVWSEIRGRLPAERTPLLTDRNSPEFTAAVEQSKARAIRRYPDCANPNSELSKKMLEIADRLEKETISCTNPIRRSGSPIWPQANSRFRPGSNRRRNHSAETSNSRLNSLSISLSNGFNVVS